MNPCFGEYYVDIDGKYRPTIFYREFTLTIAQVVDEFGIENVSDNIRGAYEQRRRSPSLARSLLPTLSNRIPSLKFGIPQHFAYRETCGNTAVPTPINRTALSPAAISVNAATLPESPSSPVGT